MKTKPSLCMVWAVDGFIPPENGPCGCDGCAESRMNTCQKCGLLYFPGESCQQCEEREAAAGKRCAACLEPISDPESAYTDSEGWIYHSVECLESLHEENERNAK